MPEKYYGNEHRGKGISVPGTLVTGTYNGFVVDAKDVRGTYIVLQDYREYECVSDGVKVDGTIFYIVNEDKEYRVRNGALVPIPKGMIYPPIDSNIYAMQDGRWIKLDLNKYATKEELQNYYDKGRIDDFFHHLGEDVRRKQDQLISSVNIKTVAHKDVLGKGNVDIFDGDVICTIKEPTTYAVGGLTEGTNLNGMTLKQILAAVFNGAINPELTAPSLSAVLNKRVFIADKTSTMSGTLYFDRGHIFPRFGTSGYRSGELIEYVIDKQEVHTKIHEYEFSTDVYVEKGSTPKIFMAAYEEGEQPKNNMGGNYDEPLPAGSVSDTVNIVGLIPAYVGKSIEGLQEIALTDRAYFECSECKNRAGYYITTPSYCSGLSDEDVNTFAIPGYLEVCGIKVWDELTHSYEWLYGTPEASLAAFPMVGIKVMDNGELYRVYQSNAETECYPLSSRRLAVFFTI